MAARSAAKLVVSYLPGGGSWLWALATVNAAVKTDTSSTSDPFIIMDLRELGAINCLLLKRRQILTQTQQLFSEANDI